MKKKFNKANVSEVINNWITGIQNDNNFDPNNGVNQLIAKAGGYTTIIDYGKYIALKELHEELFSNDKNFYKLTK